MNHFFKVITLTVLLSSCSSNSSEEEIALSQTIKAETEIKQQKNRLTRNTRHIIKGNYELVQSTSGIHEKQTIKVRFRTRGPIIESINNPYCFDFNVSLRKIDSNPTLIGSIYTGEIGFYSLLLLQHLDQTTYAPIECSEADEILEDFAPYFWNPQTILENTEDSSLITKFTYNIESKQLTLLSNDGETTKFVFNKIQ